MRGIILAAGRGRRMGAITDDQPKCLIVLEGKTLLQWQIAALSAGNVKPLAVVSGYQAQALDSPNYDLFYNSNWAETNMVMSLMAANSWLRQDTCIVSYSDIVYHPHIVCALSEADGDIVITYDMKWQSLWTQRFTNPLCDAETLRVDKQGQLLDIGQRAQLLDEIQGQYMGLLKFTPQGWTQVEMSLADFTDNDRNGLDMTSLLHHLLQRGIPIQTVGVEGRWCEVDSEKDLKLYTRLIGELHLWDHDWKF